MELRKMYRVGFSRERVSADPQGGVSVLAENCATQSSHLAILGFEETLSLLQLNLAHDQIVAALESLKQGEPLRTSDFHRSSLRAMISTQK
jgi:hypothetical protein